MHTAAYTLFDTAVGRCGLAWRGDAVCGFALPGADDDATVRALRRRLPDALATAPSGPIAAAIEAIVRLMAGQSEDLSFITVDLEGVPAFDRAVYEELRAVPLGETVTYGELAARCGAPRGAQAVGAAMGRNPIPLIIPCHRVLAKGGGSGGFSAPGGLATKMRLLQLERAGRGSGLSLFEDLPLAVRSLRRG